MCFLIDDDIDDQEIFLMALKEVSEQISCIVADDVVEALGKLSEGTAFIPDYIFLDVNTPKMNGIECLRRIKAFKHLQGTRLIMFSTSAEPKLISASKALGADGFLIKPSCLKELIEALTGILET